MWQHRKPRSPSHQSSSLRRTRCERKRAITVRTLPCAYTNIWRPQTVAMRESRMTRNGHVRFGERGRETRLPQGRKVRSAPTLFSPLLANIALQGMEEAVLSKRNRKHVEQPILIRYADDYVVLHSDLEKLKQAEQKLIDWLADMGLHMNPKKTTITHTLTPYEGKVGFDFLGFSVRQFPVGKTHTGKNTVGKPLGFKTIIRPS